MTLREVTRGWALRHRDAWIERVQTDRALVLAERHDGGTEGSVRALQLRQYRDERRLAFWDDLYMRLTRPHGGEIPGGKR